MVLVPSGAGVVAQPSVAVGSPLTRAVRLGGLARSGTVVVSETTAQLVAGYFDCKACSDPALADRHEVRMVYEVLGASALQTRVDIGIARGLTPLVGRAAELALLRDRWTSVQEGRGQVVLLRGKRALANPDWCTPCKPRWSTSSARRSSAAVPRTINTPCSIR